MPSILSVTSPVFFIIALGYAVTVLGVFKKEEIQHFGKWVINIALPALLFKSLSAQRFDQLLNANRTVGQLETKLNQLESPKL